ncbi:MAG: hypothetical protein EA374_08490 [Acholeplasmatales bacterium]|nr:MAG: hypothetical protein EA374_08490 [Acholeplasmatales bacterium]
MINALVLIVIAASILAILFFAFMTKSKLASYVAYTILASVAVTMALNGFAGLIRDVDFLSFLVDLFRFLASIVVIAELALILFLLLMSKHKTKVLLLKIAIVVYVVLTLLVELGAF